MISVLNPLRLLNGNKFLGLFIVLLLATTGCKTKKATYSDPKLSQKGKPEVVKPKDKEIKPNNPRNDNPKDTSVVTASTNTKSGPQSQAHISMLVPFNAKSYYPGGEKLSKETERFLNFYQGFLLGMDKMNTEGLTTYLDVYDTRKNMQIFDEKLKNIDTDQTDMVIGTYNTSNIKALANWSRENKVISVSPWKSSSSVSQDNPYFFQVSPTLDMYLESIVDHVNKMYGQREVVVVSRDIEKEKKHLNKLIKINSDKFKGNGVSMTSLILSTQLSHLTPEQLEPIIKKSGPTVVILPYYKSEEFVQAFLARLAVAGVDHQVVVYGMPQWADFNSLSLGQLINLNARLPMHQYVDNGNYQIKSFNRLYFDKYGMIPTHNESYKGYDLALFLGRSYRDHGSDFLLEKDGLSDNFSTIKISVDRNVPDSNARQEDYSKINFFENKAIQMCEFGEQGLYRLD